MDIVPLRRGATPAKPTFEPIERFVDHGVLADVSPIEVEYLTDLGQILASVFRYPTGDIAILAITNTVLAYHDIIDL